MYLPRHTPRKVSRAIVPNAVTGGAIFSGYVSIMFAFDGKYGMAAIFILVSAVLDMFDGHIARIMKATSAFGEQFDSLADVVNYGVAPSVLFYLLYFEGWGIAGMALGFLLVLCAALRLARFNVITSEAPGQSYFVGLPTTMAAAFLAGYILFTQDINQNYGTPFQAAILLIIVSLLMVSEVQYGKSKLVLSPRRIRQKRHIAAGTIIIPMLVFYPTFTFFTLALFYILWGLSRSGIHTIKDHTR